MDIAIANSHTVCAPVHTYLHSLQVTYRSMTAVRTLCLVYLCTYISMWWRAAPRGIQGRCSSCSRYTIGCEVRSSVVTQGFVSYNRAHTHTGRRSRDP